MPHVYLIGACHVTGGAPHRQQLAGNFMFNKSFLVSENMNPNQMIFTKDHPLGPTALLRELQELDHREFNSMLPYPHRGYIVYLHWEENPLEVVLQGNPITTNYLILIQLSSILFKDDTHLAAAVA